MQQGPANVLLQNILKIIFFNIQHNMKNSKYNIYVWDNGHGIILHFDTRNNKDNMVKQAELYTNSRISETNQAYNDPKKEN